MELKKTPKADLQNKKTLFFEIGLGLSLLVVLVAFNWTSKEKTPSMLIAEHQEIVEETGRGGPYICETSRLPHFLDNGN
jgi:protein TonB